MTTLIGADTRVAVHGVFTKYAQAPLKTMRAVGTRIVAGISVGSAGESLGDIPIFDTMQQAAAATGANASIIFVPAPGLLDAVVESADAGMRLIVAVAEHVPLQDSLRCVAYARSKGSWLVGPNTVGMVVPGVGMLGSFSLDYVRAGHIAVLSRSGSLTSNTARQLSLAGLGQSICVHMGGDYVCGRNPGEYLELLDQDPTTRVIAYCGEVGGTKEYDMIRYLGRLSKPVVAMIVGRHAPAEKRLGHAGALILSDRDTANAKRAALSAAGVHLARDLVELAEISAELLARSLAAKPNDESGLAVERSGNNGAQITVTP